MRQMHAPTVAGNPPARSWAGRLAWALALGSTVLVLISVVVGIRYAVTSSDWRSLLTHQLLTPFIAIAYAALGALVVSRQPRNPIGWLLVATGAIGALNLAVVAYDAFGGLPLSEWLVLWSWLLPTILSTMAIFF